MRLMSNIDELDNATGQSSVRVESDPGYQLRDDSERMRRALIMMVDDEPLTMNVVRTLLEDAGYQRFLLEQDSTRAIEQIRTSQPDVLLLDIMMPEVDGFQILGELRRLEEFAHLPVIVLTSSSSADSKLKALDLGATDFLAKPVDPSELALRVRNTLAAKAYQDQLAYYDGVTGLPNRKLFLDRCEWSIERAMREEFSVALLHIVFDEYQRIRESFGPQAGDQVITELSRRLDSSLRSSDVVGRLHHEASSVGNLYCLGGSEFSVLLPSIGEGVNASLVGQRILEQVSQPILIEGTEVLLKPSVGISTFPHDAIDATTLVSLAVSASGQAQASGGGRVQFYSSEMNEASVGRLRLESQMRRALAEQEFFMVYQPKISLDDERIVGAEALVRWKMADGSIVSPADFIPIAEESGLIVPLGSWILEAVCRQIAEWNREGIRTHVAVNISARQFFESDLVGIIARLVEKYRVDPGQLTLEVTESLMMEDPRLVVDLLHRLKDRGFMISIDDFGTGYSSLSYLKDLPADELKIDRAFIMDVEASHEDRAMVNAIVFMAHELGLRVCAEGVENSAQLKFLRSIECDVCQGFHFSRPVTPEVLWEKLQQARVA